MSKEDTPDIEGIDIVYPELAWSKAEVKMPTPTPKELKQGILHAQIIVPVEKITIIVKLDKPITEEALTAALKDMMDDEDEECDEPDESRRPPWCEFIVGLTTDIPLTCPLLIDATGIPEPDYEQCGECSVCDKEHWRAGGHGQPKTVDWKCPWCDEVFSSKKLRGRHVMEEHDDDLTPFTRAQFRVQAEREE
jgi:hypothetical protein